MNLSIHSKKPGFNVKMLVHENNFQNKSSFSTFFWEIMMIQFKILFQIIKSMVTICITRNIILWTMTLRELIIVRLK